MSRLSNLLNPYKGLPREIYVIFIARIVNAIGCFVMPLLTIILTQKIGLSEQDAGTLLSAAGLVYLPAAMIGGKLADTFGRKYLIIIFDTLAAILYIICGLIEPSMTMVYVLIAAGVCMYTAGPAHDSLIADLTTPDNRDGAYALIYMGWNIGFAVGPMLGGLLYRKYLPLVFIGDAVTALLAMSLIFIFVKETFHKTKEEITDEKRKLERRESGSILEVLWKRPILIFFSLIAFGYNFTYSQWTFLLPMHSIQNFNELGAQYYGWIASFNGLVVILFTPIVTKLTGNIKNIRRMVYGGLLYAAGFGGFGLIAKLPMFFVMAYIFTIGEIVLSISVMPFIANHTPASHRGRMSAILPMILGLGYTLGPLGMGRMLNYTSIEEAWLVLGVLTTISAAFMFLLEKYEERTQVTEQTEAEQMEVESAEAAETIEVMEA